MDRGAQWASVHGITESDTTVDQEYMHIRQVGLCEMKIFPAISINKKCHSHQQCLASICE